MYMCDNQQTPRRRDAKRHEAPFVERMIRIIACYRKRIQERARGLIERDFMFPQVRRSFSIIPFEAHLYDSPHFSIAADS